MLKLLKYEWKACARICLPLYGVLILMSFVTHLLYSIPQNSTFGFMLPTISYMLYMGVMMAAFVVTAVILIQRFYKNLLGSEGYLMFTLPVTVSQHLFSKTIIAVVMIALSGIAAFLSIGIFADMSFGTLFVDMIKGVGAERRPAVRAGAARAGCPRHCGHGAVRLYVHCAWSSGKPSPPAHVDRVVRCSFYRPAGSSASGDDGRGQYRAAAVRRPDESLVERHTAMGAVHLMLRIGWPWLH